MKTSPLKTRRESIWSNRPEHQDLQESRSGRPWADHGQAVRRAVGVKKRGSNQG